MTAGLVTIASTVAASTAPEKYGGKGEFPSPRLLIGTAITFAGLGIAMDAAPGIAGPLSWCIAFTAITYYGMPVLNKSFGKEK